MRDHPECVHGMVVAMNDTSSQEVKWATGKGATENIYEWAKKSFNEFTSGEQADWEEIQESDIAFGYYRSRLMALYGSRNSDTTFPVYDAIATYATTYPAPAGSSGWFLPGSYELATLCFGVPTNFAGDYTQLNMLKKTINPQIDKAVGDKLIGEYWSGNEWGSLDKVWHVDVTTPTMAQSSQPIPIKSAPCLPSERPACGSCEIKRFINPRPAKERRTHSYRTV